MSSLPRTVLIPSSPLRFSGVVPARHALVFDARGERWVLRHEGAPASGREPREVPRPIAARPMAPAPPAAYGARAIASHSGVEGVPSTLEPLRSPGWPGLERHRWSRRGNSLGLGVLGIFCGLAASALVDRHGPVAGPVGSGTSPLSARGGGAASGAAPGVAPDVGRPGATAPVKASFTGPPAPLLPVPTFVLAHAEHREAAPPGMPPSHRAAATKHRSTVRRAPASDAGADDAPILNVAADPPAGRARTDRGVLDLQ